MDNVTRIYFDFFNNIFSYLLLSAMIEHRLQRKSSQYAHIIVIIFCTALSIPETPPDSAIFGLFFYLLCIAILSYPQLNKVPVLCIQYYLFSYVGSFVVQVIHTIFTLDLKFFLENPYYLSCKEIICGALLYIVYILYTNHKRIKPLHTNYQNLFSFLILAISFALSYLTLFICKTQELDTPIIPILFTSLYVLIIVCIHIYQRFIDLMTENTQAQILLEQSQMTADYSAQIESNLTELKNLRHDINQHLHILDDYAGEDNYEAIHNYISNITYNYTDAPLFHTSSDVVSALLNTKYQTAQQKEISFDIKYEFPFLHIDDFSIITILGNLIDNAITAAEKCENGWISLSLTQMDSYLQIHIKNNHKEILSKKDGEFQTTKTDNKGLHGLGIKNIRSTVKQLNGQIDITHSETEFDVNILIPNY